MIFKYIFTALKNVEFLHKNTKSSKKPKNAEK